VAARDDTPIAAVVDWFGKLPAELRQGCKRLPPTLIVHDDADKTVPVREAEALESLLKENQLSYEIKIYKNQQHLFLSEPLGKDAADARKRTIAFLAKYLKQEVALSRK
jgi:dienelactone hydrolase